MAIFGRSKSLFGKFSDFSADSIVDACFNNIDDFLIPRFQHSSDSRKIRQRFIGDFSVISRRFRLLKIAVCKLFL